MQCVCERRDSECAPLLHKKKKKERKKNTDAHGLCTSEHECANMCVVLSAAARMKCERVHLNSIAVQTSAPHVCMSDCLTAGDAGRR